MIESYIFVMSFLVAVFYCLITRSIKFCIAFNDEMTWYV